VIDRSTFLGGSDAAAVLGVSPYWTPVELWMEKTGQRKEVISKEQQRRFDRGHKLEPFIREMVIQKLTDEGHAVELLAINQRYTDPEHPFLACEIDFELMLDGEHINCDAKSVTGFARKKWGEVDTEDVPIEYAAQFMHGLMVTGRRTCLVAALRSFDDVDIYWTRRDDETIAAMRPKLVSFWVDHVLPKVAPDPMVFTDITALFSSDNGVAVEATQGIADKVSQFREVKARIKDLKTVEAALQFEIAEFISPHARLTHGGVDIATWKGQGLRKLDEKALKEAHPEIVTQYTRNSTIRVLRTPKGKQSS
jgi:putative phage-type endonuclease